MKLKRTLFSLILLLGCAVAGLSQEPAKPSTLAPNAPKDEPRQVTDSELQKFEEALKPEIEKARKTYPEARKRFLAGLPPKNVFFVTVRLADSTGRFEQVFIEVKEIKDGVIKGLIASQVEMIAGYRFGDGHSLRESELIDWTISKPDGTEEGNFVGKFIENYKPE